MTLRQCPVCDSQVPEGEDYCPVDGVAVYDSGPGEPLVGATEATYRAFEREVPLSVTPAPYVEDEWT